ncbi:MAG: hypothetical protein EG828_16145, partial [Deltaproteobacteria bacterium]|nr:hypothetical protein [Deltaproteobacteria bacterium]
LAAALGIGALAVLKRDRGTAPVTVAEKAVPEAIVEKAVPVQAKIQRQEQPQAVEPEKTVTVKKGWTLSLLAKQQYGFVNPTVLDILLEHNPQITDVNQIPADEPMTIPPLTDDRFIGRDQDGKFNIYLGTFGDQRAIQALKKHPLLQGKTFKTALRKVSSDVLWYRLTAGGFKSKEEALQALRALKKQGVLSTFPA